MHTFVSNRLIQFSLKFSKMFSMTCLQCITAMCITFFCAQIAHSKAPLNFCFISNHSVFCISFFIRPPKEGPRLFCRLRITGSVIPFTILFRHVQKFLRRRDLLPCFLLIDQIKVIIVTCMTNFLCSSNLSSNLSLHIKSEPLSNLLLLRTNDTEPNLLLYHFLHATSYSTTPSCWIFL